MLDGCRPVRNGWRLADCCELPCHLNRNEDEEIDMKRSERGGILGGLLITALAMMCLAVIAVMFVARNVHVRTSGNGERSDVSIDTPAGHLTVHANDQDGWAYTDIPRYPGAYRPSSKHHDAVVQWDSNTKNGSSNFSVTASELITQDSGSKVFEFYRNQLPSWVVKKDRGGDFELELERNGYKRIVGIHERDDGTHIGVASIGEGASN
jgi:hypothetical protein